MSAKDNRELATPETRHDESFDEQLIACRCGECESGRRRGCNSSRLRELVGALFDEKLPGLYCRQQHNPSGNTGTAPEECLCAGCSLNGGNDVFYCHRDPA